MENNFDPFTFLIFFFYVIWAGLFLFCCLELGGIGGLFIGISGLMLSFTNSLIATILIQLERSYDQ